MFAQRVSAPQSSLAPNPKSSRIADTLSKMISAPWSLFENLTNEFFMTIFRILRSPWCRGSGWNIKAIRRNVMILLED
jgi:hypothetical protein